MTISTEEFRQGLQRWASGVTVVTTATERLGKLGMTATSFASVSLDPPQILVCINDSAITSEGIRESGHFAVNILEVGQQEASNQFASGKNPELRFDSVSWSKGRNGSPLLNDSLTSLECKAIQQIRAGSHWVIIGEVEKIICRDGDPLIYYCSRYRNIENA